MGAKKKSVSESEMFNKLQVDTLIGILQNINSKIAFLINCSSEDFLQLHSNFTKVHKVINQLTTNIMSAVSMYGNENNVGFIDDLAASLSLLKKDISDAGKTMQVSSEVHGSLEKTLDHLYIAVNNFNQNLNTLLFLSAGLKLDPKIIKKAGELDVLLNNIHNSIPDLPAKIKVLLSDIKKSAKTVQSFDTNYFKTIREMIDNALALLDVLKSRTRKCNELRPEINDKIKLSSENTSTIITHLQYQDIVKQKIEHIEQSHNEILERLINLSEMGNNPEDQSVQVNLFFQIRGIAELQAAQLVYANKEYQDALETVTSKYLELISLVEEISGMCYNACTSVTSDDGRRLNPGELFEIISSIAKEVDIMENIFKLNIETIKNRLTAFSAITSEIKSACYGVANTVKKISEEFSAAETNNKSVGLLNQIKEVSDELVRVIDRIDQLSGDNVKQSLQFLNQAEKLHRIKVLEEKASTTLSNQNQLLTQLDTDYNNLNTGLKINVEQCHIPEDLVNSVHDVKYYEVFEKEIQNIIADLNKISAMIQTLEPLFKNVNKIDIEALKKRYTVSSEHVIHNKFSESKEKGTVDLFGNGISISDPNKKDEDDDNLELF